MDSRPLLKVPKLEEECAPDENPGTAPPPPAGDNGDDDDKDAAGQYEALVALIAHRAHEVEHNKQRVAYYKSQVELSEKRLLESQSQLALLLSRRKSANSSPLSSSPVIDPSPSPSPSVNGAASADASASADAAATSAASAKGDSPSRGRPGGASSRPQIVIPAPMPKIPTTTTTTQSQHQARIRAHPSTTFSTLPKTNHIADERPPKRENDTPTPPAMPQVKRPRRTIEQREHQELIPSVRKNISPVRLCFQSGTHIFSQHKRKPRCLVLSPVNDQMFATSALDGVVNLWQVQGKGIGASLLSTTDCVSPKQRRWPEDIAWHPDGDSLFAVYTADGGDSQISILNLNLSGEKKVVFLQEKPHLKGIINSILFMPWVDSTFATGGSDHAVILWQEKDDSWKPKALHREQHSSTVMGVAGLQQRKVILSVGADKRIVGYDLLSGRAEFKHRIESKCMSVLTNPSDFNLFMVQTGTPGKQLRLFDIRRRQSEIHAFGWKQASSESQSALINQAWSPDGLYLSSGSTDPMFHIFDIRYSGSSPSQSVQAHQKRVFKAVWHQSLPLLTSISSDLNIGLHKMMT
ncbi:U5 small nuclear ribonucleoprotein 40 kDa protein-like [Iris pallida]|uniref:U5 small nuclear ribonucleoprotein 40 kDa protein-like n=1 Tax=Iris pallida TaxID=29817 RepID=A0AAX6DPZ0_IRIPA|nr:U5 small nuclear ribonucleoprotein 40 kDa protein-like [Iris pallida]